MAQKKRFKMSSSYGLDQWEGWYYSRKEAEAEFKKIYGVIPDLITYSYRGKLTTFFNF